MGRFPEEATHSSIDELPAAVNSSPAQPDDAFADLIERVRSGDQEAMTQLVTQYEARVRAAARVLLGPALRPHLDSIDLAQSVHRTLLDGLQENKFDFASPDELLGLLMTVVKRKVARQWRKARRQSHPDRSEDDTAGLLASLNSREENPEGEAQIRDAVEGLLENLSGVEKQMIELRLQGYRTSEVAEQLGIDAKVLRARLSRLRARLRQEGLLSEWL